MPRGSNSEAEQERINSADKLKTRGTGHSAGTGAPAHEKEGFGGGSMQRNSDKGKDSL